MPFGFDGVFWRLMDVGIAVDDRRSRNGSQRCRAPSAAMPAFGTGPLIVASIGIIVLGLAAHAVALCGRGRACGVDRLGAADEAAGYPDLRRRSQRRGARQGRPAAYDAQRARMRFLSKEWLGGDADARLPTDASLSEGVSCDRCGLRDGAGRWRPWSRWRCSRMRSADDCDAGGGDRHGETAASGLPSDW